MTLKIPYYFPDNISNSKGSKILNLEMLTNLPTVVETSLTIMILNLLKICCDSYQILNIGLKLKSPGFDKTCPYTSDMEPFLNIYILSLYTIYYILVFLVV